MFKATIEAKWQKYLNIVVADLPKNMSAMRRFQRVHCIYVRIDRRGPWRLKVRNRKLKTSRPNNELVI